MTIAEFHAALDGYVKAHTSSTDDAPTIDEARRVLAEEMAAGRVNRG